jgi:hypothetical protein
VAADVGPVLVTLTGSAERRNDSAQRQYPRMSVGARSEATWMVYR